MSNFTTSLKRLNFRLLSFLILLSGSISAQQNFLEVPVRLDIEKGDMSEVVIKVKKDGKDAFTQSGASKMRFKLDYNRKYTLIFTKPGYITKTIEIDTKAPAARIENGFDPYKIGVKLFIQNAENMVIYNQPVAQIKYDQNLDEFNFNTDYSKSILSAISRDEEEDKPAAPPAAAPVAAAQQGEDRQGGNANTGKGADNQESQTMAPVQADTDVPSPSAPVNTAGNEPVALSTASNQEPAAETPPVSSAQNGGDLQPIFQTSGADDKTGSAPVNTGSDQHQEAKVKGDQDVKTAQAVEQGQDENRQPLLTGAGEENQKVGLNPFTASDTPNGFITADESEKITREDIVERNRVITKVKVTRKGVLTEYSRVYYSWGGLYYFKNNTMSISENLFVNWTGVRN